MLTLPPPNVFHVSESSLPHRIGLDLGGTKIEGIVLAVDGSIIARERVPTPRDYDATLVAVSALVAALERQVNDITTTSTPSSQSSPIPPIPIGLGIPGAISPATGLVKNANSTWLIGRPLAADLQKALNRPVRVMNDANCFAISEAADGAARGAPVVFGVIIGTGVGGGIVVDGHALIGPNLITGEWGHNPLPWTTPNEFPGAPCYCGKRGCIETWLSGPAFEAAYTRRTGVSKSANKIANAAAAGSTDARHPVDEDRLRDAGHSGDAGHAADTRHADDPDDVAAVATLRDYEDRLARALASVINVLDPDVIVLGGGMSNIPSLPDAVTKALPKYVFSDDVRTRVVRNLHGDSSGVRGAAWLW